MKKICLLLIIALCLSACACANIPDDASSGDMSSAEISQDASSETSETIVCEEALKIDAMLAGEAPDRGLPSKNILLGKKYKVSRESGENGSYVDTDAYKLTDGISAEQFDTYTWVGFAGGTALTIEIDLGNDTHSIADIDIGCLRQIEYGIGLPGTAIIYASVDGTEYTKLGTIYTPTTLGDTACKYTYAFHFDKALKARYIRLLFSSQECGWFFIDEITAKAYSSDFEASSGDAVNYYGDADIPFAEPSYWDDSEADLNERINLALKAPKVYVSHFSAIVDSSADDTGNTKDTSLLVDGKKASATWNDKLMFRMTRGDGRRITIDLGHISAIEEVRFDMLLQAEWGVMPVGEVGISISADGKNWQAVSSVKVDSEGKTSGMLKLTAELGAVYKARFVALTMKVKQHSAMSEIEVYGTKAIPSDALDVDPKKSFDTAYSDSYPSLDDFDGIENILCTPICRHDGNSYDEAAMITAEEFARYVGYYEDGVLCDTFFDTFLFSPCSGYVSDDLKLTLKGWQTYIDSQFVADRNINALNVAVGAAAEKLKLDGYKANVFLSVMRPTPTNADGSVNTLGDLDGDGIDDPLDNVENRKKAVKWQIDTQLAKYREQGYANLTLVGFYWQEEHIFTDDPYEVEVVKYMNDYVHSLGLLTLWIPYYEAEGFEDCKSYGFDISCLQPNYSFMSVPDDDRLDSAALQAKMFGMSVEIEMSYYSDPLNIKRYKEYLQKGVEYGYMNSIKIYYLGIIPTDLTQAYDKGDEYARSAYKDTYLYAKNKLDETYVASPPAASDAPEDASYTTSGRLDGKIVINTSETYKMVITVSPRYGSIRLEPDGSFAYYPISGYVGKDSFSVAAVFGNTISSAAVIEIECK